MEKRIALILTLVLSIALLCGCTPKGRAAWNTWWYDVQKADDVTNYETLKKVEDTCRAMIASYESDKLTYEQYKNSDNEEKQGWAEQAKMRANKTAVEYNTYVWKDNSPTDIYTKLEIIE